MLRSWYSKEVHPNIKLVGSLDLYIFHVQAKCWLINKK